MFWRALGIKTALDGLKKYGSNPMVIYVTAWLFSVFLNRFTIGEQSNSIQGWIYHNFQNVRTENTTVLAAIYSPHS
jgi:predicted acyltransferase